MMERRTTRRSAMTLGAAAGLASGARAVASGKPRAARRLDFSKPIDNVTAYLKLRASVETQDVYFWFTGRLDLAVAGEPIMPIVDVETLILRRTERVGETAWNVIDWEASMYRHPDTLAWLEDDEEILNPYTKRMVRPLNYREGPVRFRFTEREPRIIGSRDVMPNTGKPFNYPARVVAGTLWMTKSSYIRAPNWLTPEEWPAESSGKEIIVATHSSLSAPLDQVESLRVPSVRSAFAYTATSGWLPWMLMGRTPGSLIWAEAGHKLMNLDEAPAEQVARLRKVHPKFFQRPEPWPEFTNMYLQYKAARRPQKV